MKKQKIKVIIKGDGLNYQGQTDSFTAAKIVALCMESSERKIETNNNIKSTFAKESPAEYINRHHPHNNFEKILVLAGYISQHESKDWFTINGIRGLFRVAGESLPTNINRDFQVVTKRGWISKDTTSSDSKQKERYYITTTGKNALVKGFTIKK